MTQTTQISTLQGYEFIDTDTTQLVNTRTGELTDGIIVCVPPDTKILSPERQEANRNFRQQEEKKMLRWKTQNELGYFYFVLNKTTFDDLSPESAARLIYLNTYLEYHTNKLMLKRGYRMLKRDLPDVLQISRATASRFWKEVSPKYLIDTDEGLVSSYENIIKGNLPDASEYTPYEKFYIKGIRSLYEMTKQTNHRYLGYIFKMLPFINFEYNILCFNPEEKDLSNIKPLTLNDFCNLIGYSSNQLSRLLSIYRKILFEVDGHLERFCSFVYDGIDRYSAQIYVNPHIIFNGSDFTKVEILAKFCCTENQLDKFETSINSSKSA